MDTRAGRCIDVGETPKWAVPTDDLDILGSIACAPEINLISSNRAVGYGGTQAQFHFFKCWVGLLIDAVHYCLRHLVGVPCPCEYCCRIVKSARTGLSAKGETCRSPYIGPVEANSAAVNPVTPFRDQVFGERKIRGVALLCCGREGNRWGVPRRGAADKQN